MYIRSLAVHRIRSHLADPMKGKSSTSRCWFRQLIDYSYNISFATYLGSSYDASTTNFTYLIPQPITLGTLAAPLEIVISFLSPITPTSTLRQSIPASYLTIEVKGAFNVDIYVDLNGQWASGDRGSEIVWDLGTWELGSSGEGLKTWRVTKETEALLSEVRDQAEWGTLHFTGPAVSLHRLHKMKN